MDNQNYLNEISKTTPHITEKPNSLFSKKLKIIIVSAVVLLVSIIILGSTLGTNSGRNDAFDKIYLRSSLLSKEINSYKSSIKSTSLRASSTTLDTILSSISQKFLVPETKDSVILASITSDETRHIEELDNTLSHAKIIGSLDRIFASRIVYELNLILSMLSQIYEENQDPTLKSFIESSYSSLQNLIPVFEGFTPTS